MKFLSLGGAFMKYASSERAGTSPNSSAIENDRGNSTAPDAVPSPLRSLKRRALVKCWGTATRLDGESLKLHEIEVLAQRWLELFGELPSTMPGTVPTAAGRVRGASAKAAPGSELLRRKDVAQRLGIGVRVLDRMVKESRFPKPLRIGKRTVGWPRNQIDLLLGRSDRLVA
jgi:predicted DNA-binding transcriptional regulator AlpA